MSGHKNEWDCLRGSDMTHHWYKMICKQINKLQYWFYNLNKWSIMTSMLLNEIVLCPNLTWPISNIWENWSLPILVILYSLGSLVWFYCLVLFNFLQWFFLSSMTCEHQSASELSTWISSLSILISSVISSNVLTLNVLKKFLFLFLFQAWNFPLISRSCNQISTWHLLLGI